MTAFDVSDLHGFVRGYVASGQGDMRGLLQPLMLRYGFDAVERDGVLRFVMRDGKGAVALDPEGLAIHPDLDGVLTQVRASEAEMAGRVRLDFVQAEGDYDAISAKRRCCPMRRPMRCHVRKSRSP